MKIVIDSREQKPDSFSGHETEVAGLPGGDYSIAGLESHVAVERKSIDDLIGCLCGDRSRFEKELFRGKCLDYFALVIEGSMEDITKGRYRSRMTPQSALQSIVAFSIRYSLPVWFAGDRQQGQYITASLLIKLASEVEKKWKALGSE